MTECITIVGSLLTLLGVAPLSCENGHRASPDGTSVPAHMRTDIARGGAARLPADERLGAAEVQRRVETVYDRVCPALVRWNDQDSGGSTRSAVIVTAEGHILIPATPAGRKLTFQLPQGRRVTGRTLGWSWEWGVGLAKLEGPGPWPHVELAEPIGIRAGQCVIAIGYTPPNRRTLVPGPVMGVSSVTKSATGWWFMTSDTSTFRWGDTNLAFDLDGRLAGVGCRVWWPEGTVYTEAKLIRTLWDDLAAGKNLDQVRLLKSGGRERRGPNGQAAVAKRAIPEAAEAKARAATVRIRRTPDDRGFSGVLVSADGLIATCAHHFVMPGAKVIVCLPDGRDATGNVVGINLICDVGLVRINDRGPWPHVETGDSTKLRPGDPCLSIGYGPTKSEDRPPSVRKSSIMASGNDHEEYRLCTDSSIPFVGGDSGGGIFDADGRLVAIHQELGGTKPDGVRQPHRHPRVELIAQHWDELNTPLRQTASSSLTAAEADLQRSAGETLRSVVEVLDGQSLVALGTVVGRDGLVLTKASALPEAPACRLADRRVLPARVSRIARKHDLAILKIEAADLSVADWAAADDPRTGTILAVARPGGKLTAGFISHPPLSIPPERGALWANLQGASQGLEVVEVYKEFRPRVLQKGDVIQAIDGRPVPDLKAYRNLLYPKDGDPIAIPGDQLRLAVVRQGKKIEVRLLLAPQELPQPEGQSPRYSGFALAYSVTVDPKCTLGGPVLDRNGRVLGIAIAWRAGGWLLALPAATAKTVLREFKRE